jgi:hypothetical protein
VDLTENIDHGLLLIELFSNLNFHPLTHASYGAVILVSGFLGDFVRW